MIQAVINKTDDVLEMLKQSFDEAKRDISAFMALQKYIHRKTKLNKNIHGKIN